MKQIFSNLKKKGLEPENQSKAETRIYRLLSGFSRMQLPFTTCVDICDEIVSPLSDADTIMEHELNYLCDIFEQILSDLANIILESFARHIEKENEKKTLESFVDAIGQMMDNIGGAYYSSKFEVFHRMYQKIKEVI